MKCLLLFAFIVIFAFTQMAYGTQWACNLQRDQECRNRCQWEGAYCVEIPEQGEDGWNCRCAATINF
ncbi:hypothetical protein TSAR_016438 [Trichomalopsis sarcophagae]|uniref:Uncharacterized protein n=1 Tax=Trichomalopsis sarcophagae TaxID=543379 RepID=A0A232EVT6_9HYME|nr:hypothetical protein TSAR_016438 [Trichomalopsis sarcophagae]